MNRLFVYGDSFSVKSGKLKSWTNIVANDLQLALYNRSIAGSSAEYSFKQLIEDIQRNDLDHDIFIYVPSHPGRLHFEYQNDRPETASNFMHDPTLTLEGNFDWYWKNKDHIEWWLTNYDQKLLELNHQAYIETLKVIALENPTCTFAVIPAFENHFKWHSKLVPANFLYFNINLFEISWSEVDPKNEKFDYFDWIEHTKDDVRTNHLTLPNLKKLASIVSESIANKNVSDITYSDFEKSNICKIQYKHQYLNYIEQGILECNTAVLERLTDR
jgi:hypothetical protein